MWCWFCWTRLDSILSSTLEFSVRGQPSWSMPHIKDCINWFLFLFLFFLFLFNSFSNPIMSLGLETKHLVWLFTWNLFLTSRKSDQEELNHALVTTPFEGDIHVNEYGCAHMKFQVASDYCRGRGDNTASNKYFASCKEKLQLFVSFPNLQISPLLKQSIRGWPERSWNKVECLLRIHSGIILWRPFFSWRLKFKERP